MGYKVKVEMKTSKEIEKKLGIDNNGSATEFLRDDVYRLYQPYVPRNNGNLYREVTFPNKRTIKHTAPYAHYHYKGILYLTKSGSSWAKLGERKYPTNRQMTYTHGGPEWDKRMMNDRRHDVEKDLQNFIKNGGK